MAHEHDWIEQDEFERRRSLFGATAQKSAVSRSRCLASRQLNASTHSQSSDQPERTSEVNLTLVGLAGDTLWGPSAVCVATRVDEFLVNIADELPKGRPMRLMRGDVRLGCAEPVADDQDTEARLTLIFLDHLPEGANIVGDLVVWSPKERSTQGSEADTDGVPRLRHDRTRTQVLVGYNGRTEEVFFHKLSLGRCNYLSLRVGCRGLYYNSSSHGTATLAFQVYADAGETAHAERPDSDDEDSTFAERLEGNCTETHAIIPGPHCHSAKSRNALVEARRLIGSLFLAAGRSAPVVTPSVLSRWQPTTPSSAAAAKAWTDLLTDLGIDDPAASLWAVLYMPWIDTLGALNETEIWEWERAGYPDSLDEMPEDSRQRIQRGMEEHY
eukprot:TRINITY_DN65713_c0_g1_i1.p1 TRINITY_DN65713_c0_g1~~TRINITY_DN65713_c0_g1_i1.p1  ORF type:complete len:385 (-),score=46.43 TRINITY_DN65713_c0_g1_i1:111-1265(-)